MDLIDDLNSELAIAFLVEKKYSKNLGVKERRALIRKIRETLSLLAPAEKRENESSPASKNSAGRGN